MRTAMQTLFTGWHFMRWVRLVFGLVFLVQAINKPDTLLGLAAGFFLLTAITNTGCCGAGTCSVRARNQYNKERDEIQNEEMEKQ